jgi:hypothetical protein
MSNIDTQSLVHRGMPIFITVAIGKQSVTESSVTLPPNPRWNAMPSANRIQKPEPLYSMAELKALRRDILQYARWFPPGSERNQHRQVALSLRRLFKNQKWLAAHTLDG